MSGMDITVCHDIKTTKYIFVPAVVSQWQDSIWNQANELIKLKKIK